MIFAKILNKNKSGCKRKRVEKLANYIASPESENNNEKCVYFGSRNFFTDSFKAQIAEMFLLSFEAVRSKDPINHYVLSWQAGEFPTTEQVDQAVDIFLKEMGLEEHYTFFGLHADTDNIHLHLMVNRAHPYTEKVLKINKGFDIIAGHRAIAKIEFAQGWKKEPGAIFDVTKDGELVDTRRERENRLGKNIKDKEAKYGEKSVLRIVQERALEPLKNSGTWEELHVALAKLGMRYKREGSGAVIEFGDVHVKASAVAYWASLGKMQKKLGAYRPPGENLALDTSAENSCPLDTAHPLWAEYNFSRRRHNTARQEKRGQMKSRHSDEKMALLAEFQAERKVHFAGSWVGRGAERNKIRTLLAADHARRKKILQERQAEERKKFFLANPAFPGFEEWLIGRGELLAAKKYRFRLRGIAVLSAQGVYVQPALVGIAQYQPKVLPSGNVEFYLRDRLAFVDTGHAIAVENDLDHAAIWAAMQIAQQKWGKFEASGSREFLQAVVSIAGECWDLHVANRELQEAIAQARNGEKYDEPQCVEAPLSEEDVDELYARIESVFGDGQNSRPKN